MDCGLGACNVCGTALGRDLPEIRTAASDSRITYVGRTLKEGDNVSFDWTGVYVKVSFEGSYLSMIASDTKANYYDIWIDREADATADKTIRVSGNDSLYVLVEPSDLKSLNSKGKAFSHSVIMKKRTEGEQGRTTISQFITKAGEIIQSEGLKERQFEVVGD